MTTQTIPLLQAHVLAATGPNNAVIPLLQAHVLAAPVGPTTLMVSDVGAETWTRSTAAPVRATRVGAETWMVIAGYVPPAVSNARRRPLFLVS